MEQSLGESRNYQWTLNSAHGSSQRFLIGEVQIWKGYTGTGK